MLFIIGPRLGLANCTIGPVFDIAGMEQQTTNARVEPDTDAPEAMQIGNPEQSSPAETTTEETLPEIPKEHQELRSELTRIEQDNWMFEAPRSAPH